MNRNVTRGEGTPTLTLSLLISRGLFVNAEKSAKADSDFSAPKGDKGQNYSNIQGVTGGTDQTSGGCSLC